MNLENVTVEMRPRGEWEAADFGVRMIRRDAAAIYRVWFSITLPLLFLALLVIVYSPYPTLAVLIYWWLEPVADGPILRIISRRLFGEDADVRAALRSVFQLAWRNKIFLITPYRFHFARSIAMPVTQLEGLKGAARRSRAKVLNLKILNHGTGVTVAYQHLVLALYFGVILLGFALVPATYQHTIGLDWMGLFWEENSRSASALSLVVIYFAQTAMQPWFIGAGFGLYINCRTQLEAWDIEVAFRRLIQRRVSGVAAAVVLAILVVPAALVPDRAVAQESADSTRNETPTSDPGFAGFWSDDDIQPALAIVIAKDALKTTREIEEWQAIDPDEPVPDIDSGLSKWWIDLIQNFGRLMAVVTEFGLWIIVALLLCLLFVTRKRWLPYLGYRPRARPSARRIILASGELSAEFLPDDIPAEVLRLWNDGEKRKALSLLYRGSVVAAVSQYAVRLPSSATEGACIFAVGQQTDAAQSEYFRRVVLAWIRCAYGFQEPDDDAILPLCREWPQHYGATA